MTVEEVFGDGDFLNGLLSIVEFALQTDEPAGELLAHLTAAGIEAFLALLACFEVGRLTLFLEEGVAEAEEFFLLALKIVWLGGGGFFMESVHGGSRALRIRRVEVSGVFEASGGIVLFEKA